ncbi:amino acid adenylation domain-containing protein [Rhizobiaceae bacterium BDR2-2]|uniref:Amino acid adenylation domain-containing protein n=1 Tax=Ectorhizobium quercum TaxID=2965071 RepID=A0AAE3MW13_9HYPH|nr:amino acid adenylation domain-containing protein [Ectorhizobium quercum]MCX8995983.1 amino acid adenylation domain-containing protein [Ectorhizobium quercum]
MAFGKEIEAGTADDTGAGLTEAQSGLWYFQRIEPENPILNTGQYIEMRGSLDVAAFRTAVDRMVAEADALALRFTETGNEVRQVVDEDHRPWLEVADLTGEADPEAAALADMRRDTATPLDPEKDRLVLFRLYILSGNRAFWYERAHHLVIDGYGWVLVTNRVGEIYSALVNGVEPGPALRPLTLAVEDDATYRASEKRETDRAWWLETMSGMPEVASLASGRAVSAQDFIRHTIRLDAGRLRPLTALAERASVTWPDALTALVAAYCQRFAGAAETVVGVPHMGRLGSPTARVPCMWMNVLPLRVRPDEDIPIGEWLAGVSKDLVKARRHGRYRSEQLRRDLGLIGGHRRLFGPMVNVQPFDVPPKMAGLDVTLHILGAGAVDDITFTFRGDPKDATIFEVDANPGLYSRADAAAHAQRLLAFLDRASEAAALAEVPTASPDEARRFLFDLNATDHAVPDTTLVALIEETFRATPGATALVFEGHTLTYADLDRRSAALAAQLASMGAGRETIVAVALPRSLELVVALVAILRAGAAYLPLDLDHPDERIARILASAGPVAVLALDADAGRFGEKVLAVSRWAPEGQAAPSPARPGDAARPDDMAYVIYTSGSTGEPKGVVIEHRAIVNRLVWMRDHYGVDATDRILQKTPATFDVSVWEFFLPLIAGATLIVAPPGAHRDPAAIAALIRDERITTLHFVPSMLSAFLASPASRGLVVKRVFCSGEELTADQCERFHRTLSAELHNLYGPTEAAVDVSSWPATRDDRSLPVPIGFPVWNTRLYVLDERLRPLPAGVAGHLYLGGVQLARGYLGRPDLTAERFLPDPFRPGERIYKTGDLARFREDGAVVFLGRSDHQVKIRGLRIELGEIEAAIMASGLVREAGVVAREDRPGDRRIVAYLVPGDGFGEAALRAHLTRTLPDYMMPSAFVELPALPVTANGKLNRAALPAPAFRHEGASRPATPTEAAVGALFAKILGLPEPAGPEADFFALGGDSLSGVHLVLAFAERFGFDPGLGALFERPTVAALAALVDSGVVGPDEGLGPLIRLAEGKAGNPPLFLVHPAGGIAWGYRTLARALAAGRPVYGLQSPALDPAAPMPESLAVLASGYVERIRAVQPQGPYHIGGWSLGGIIAQEMAAQLQAAGAQVGVVALLDSYPADCWRAEPEPSEVDALRALIVIAGHDPEKHPDLVTREAIFDFLRQGDSPLGNLPASALEGVVRVVPDTNRLVRGHFHSHYGGVLTHVLAALDHEGTDLRPELWLAYADGVDVIPVPFLHPQLTSARAVELIAPHLAERLRSFDRTEDET